MSKQKGYKYIVRYKEENATLITILLPKGGKEISVWIPAFNETFFDGIRVYSDDEIIEGTIGHEQS